VYCRYLKFIMTGSMTTDALIKVHTKFNQWQQGMCTLQQIPANQILIRSSLSQHTCMPHGCQGYWNILQIFVGSNSCSLIFADASDHAHYTLYSNTYFTGLIFADSRLSTKIAKIGPHENFPLKYTVLIQALASHNLMSYRLLEYIFITPCWWLFPFGGCRIPRP
jgi:hypothetical protein